MNDDERVEDHNENDELTITMKQTIELKYNEEGIEFVSVCKLAYAVWLIG